MKINRDIKLTITSTMLLFACMLSWDSLFLFAKTSGGYPGWASELPYVFMAQHILVAISLFPSIIFVSYSISLVKSIAFNEFIALFVILFILRALESPNNIIGFLPADYLLNIVVFHIPVIFVLSHIRGIIEFTRNKNANKRVKHDAQKAARVLP